MPVRPGELVARVSAILPFVPGAGPVEASAHAPSSMQVVAALARTFTTRVATIEISLRTPLDDRAAGRCPRGRTGSPSKRQRTGRQHAPDDGPLFGHGA